jgi:hypothetical protein
VLPTTNPSSPVGANLNFAARLVVASARDETVAPNGKRKSTARSGWRPVMR